MKGIFLNTGLDVMGTVYLYALTIRKATPASFLNLYHREKHNQAQTCRSTKPWLEFQQLSVKELKTVSDCLNITEHVL